MALPDLPLADARSDELVRFAVSPEPGRLDLARVFDNGRDVELEVGVGKGRFLLLAASAKPATNFLGIEYVHACVEKTVDRLGKRNLSNVRVVHAEALSFIAERIPDASIAAVHVYFPDPWPKKRHHKRRFIRPAVLDELARIMATGAPLRVVTDHAEYAEVIRDLVPGHGAFADTSDQVGVWDLPGMGDYTLAGVTNFEIKYRRQGRPIFKFVWRRR